MTLVAYNEDLLEIIKSYNEISVEELAVLYADDSLEFDLKKLVESRKIIIKENIIKYCN